MDPLELLGLPPRLAARAFDDLHQVAVGGRSFLAVLGRLEERADRIQDQLDATLAAADSINATAERALALLEQLDARAQAVLDLGREIDTRAGALLGLGERIDDRGSVLSANAQEVADRAAEMIAILPTLERAVALATPLEGAVERLGRVVDRLPGEARKRARTSKE